MSGERPAKPFAMWWARDIVTAEHCTLSQRARALLLLLASYANAAHYCTPSITALHRGIGGPPAPPGKRISRSIVQRARAELVAAGLVIVFAGGQGPKATNGYWLAVSGIPPDGKGRSPAALTLSTRAAPQRPIVVHKGRYSGTVRAAPQRPEVTREVSKERARVSSPPLTTKRGKRLLRDGYTDWATP